jgi:predicted nucleic acid-binding protein
LKSVLIDSDILIEVSRARDDVILARWKDLSQSVNPLLCSPVTVAEVWHGARPFGHCAGDYLRQYAKSHPVELGDALIAATASVHKLDLWTRNRRHYPMKDIAFY